MGAARPSLALPLALLITGMVTVQIGASFAKQLFPLVGPQGATTLRLLFAAAIMLVVWRPWRMRLSRRSAPWIALYGAALGAMNLFFYLSIETIPLGVAVALEFTGPLAVAMAGSRRPLDFLWVLLAIAGVIVLLPISPAASALNPVGVAFALAAGACWALYIVFGRRAGAENTGQAAAYGMLVAAVVAAPAGAFSAGADLLSWTVVPIALGVAVLSSAIPYSLEMYALPRIPSRTFGILMSLEPAVAALAGLVLLHERLTSLQWAAIACVIAASAGSTITAKVKPAIEPIAP